MEDNQTLETEKPIEPPEDEMQRLTALFNQQQYQEICSEAGKLVQHYPKSSFLWKILGVAYQKQGRLDDALRAKEMAVSLNPDDDQALNNLGYTYQQTNRLEESERVLRRALEISPDSVVARNNLGLTLEKMKRFDEAEECYRKCFEANPTYPTAAYNYANILVHRERYEEAESYYHRAIVFGPDDAKTYSNLGYLYEKLVRLQEAESCYRRALKLAPDYADSHYNFALLLMLQGRLLEGWREYQWFYHPRCTNPSKPKPPEIPAKKWQGEPLLGKTVLIYTEQGFGDMIQFVRYAQHLQQGGASVWVYAMKPLETIFATIPWVDRVIKKEDLSEVQCDFWTYPLNLPFRFKTELQTIPCSVPYLFIDKEKSAWWKIWLDKQIPKENKRVGLVWAGRPVQGNDKNRSLNLDQFADWADLPGITFVSLQLGEKAKQLENPPDGLNIIEAGSFIQDFSDSAALLENLDVLITVCSAPAHLAGALNLPVWTIISRPYDWRWLLEGDGSPWYKSMRLFRQPTSGDWDSVLQEVKKALLAL